MLNRDELRSEHGGANAPTGKTVRHLRTARTESTGLAIEALLHYN
jgi:hypothetical protein